MSKPNMSKVKSLSLSGCRLAGALAAHVRVGVPKWIRSTRDALRSGGKEIKRGYQSVK